MPLPSVWLARDRIPKCKMRVKSNWQGLDFKKKFVLQHIYRARNNSYMYVPVITTFLCFTFHGGDTIKYMSKIITFEGEETI